MHLDYPTFITRNVSLDQIKENFNANNSSNVKNSGGLMKINIHRKNGTIDSEYYPSLEEVYANTHSSTTDFDAKIVEKK
jgi:hypothetical protein